jgi:cupredoxin-like protein
MTMGHTLRKSMAAALLIGATALGADRATAQEAGIELVVRNHQFQPGEIRGPANARITLRVKNLDAAPMEFESVSLRVEKVIAGNGEGVIRLRPLAPGRYEFFDDFRQQTRGALVIQ